MMNNKRIIMIHGLASKPPEADVKRLWHNYACLGDVVAHDSTLKDDFFKKMHKLGILPEENARDYEKLYNPFKKPSDKKQNPHKSYGYLVQPKLSKWLIEFLND